LVGKFDRVADQVQQDLRELSTVAAANRKALFDFNRTSRQSQNGANGPLRTLVAFFAVMQNTPLR
jgi:hypothetical protein